MKKYALILIVIVSVMIMMGLSAPSTAASTLFQSPLPTPNHAEVFHYKSESASADAYSPNECGYTSVYVFATKGRIHTPPGPPMPTSVAYVSVWQQDFCNQTSVNWYGWTELDASEFQITGNLNSATLATTIPAYDYNSDSWVDVSVNAVWTGGEDRWGGTYHNRYQGPGYRVNYRSQGSYRSAEATGSVVVGTMNYTPNGFDYGRLENATNGSVYIDQQ